MTPERRAELPTGWVRFLRFVELQRRIDAREPLIRLVRDDNK